MDTPIITGKRKEKAKRGTHWTRQALPFVIVYALSMVGAGLLARLLPNSLFNYDFEIRAAVVAVTSVILIGAVQVLWVERWLKKPMRGWMLYTAVGAFLMILLGQLVNNIPDSFIIAVDLSWPMYQFLGSLALNAPVALMQALWLRRRVKRAWLWPLLTIPLLMAFSAVPYDENRLFFKSATLLSVGAMQALLMLYFWRPENTLAKAKRAAQDDDDETDARRARLQLDEHGTSALALMDAAQTGEQDRRR